MPFKVIVATNYVELETQLNTWEEETEGLTINKIIYNSMGSPSGFSQFIPGKSMEQHTVLLHYTIAGGE